MIRLSLSLLLSLVVYVSCDKLPTCTQFYANIPASADNYNITSPDPASSILHVAGSFRIFFQHCEPSSQTAKKSRHKTVIICHHGLSYNHHYWDIQYQPETYSFVRHAAAEGFPTLIYDTIGAGKSPLLDPTYEVQFPLQLAIAAQISRWVKAGHIPVASRSFDKIVQLGHSHGSRYLHSLVADYSELVDAAVLKGFSHVPMSSAQIQTIAVLAPAEQLDPSKWGTLDPNYLLQVNESNKAVTFYYNKPGVAYDLKALDYDWNEGGPLSVGDASTPLVTPDGDAPHFKGPLAIINGNCGYGASSVPAKEKPFYPKSKLHYDLIPHSGHSINFHFTAPSLYSSILDWLESEGF